jgi:hypothetical protein
MSFSSFLEGTKLRKMILGALAALFLVGSAFGVQAAPPEDKGPGPNGNNDHGLCTAYFNGQKKGHDKNGQPGPFAALTEHAEEQHPNNNDDDPNNDVRGTQAVFDYCSGVEKGIGGNPDENGRYTDCFTDDDGEAGNDCTDGADA